MQLSQEAPQPGPIPVPARLPGLRLSVASPPQVPHPGSPSQLRCRVACRGSRTQPEQEPTPQQAGAGRRSGPAPGGGTAPASPLRDSRLSCPAPAALGPPLHPALLPWRRGRPLRCGATRLNWLNCLLLVSAGRRQQVCPSVPRRRSKCALPPPCGRSTPHTLPRSGDAAGPLSSPVETRLRDRDLWMSPSPTGCEPHRACPSRRLWVEGIIKSQRDGGYKFINLCKLMFFH